MPESSQAQSLAGVFPPRLVARLHREGFEGALRIHSGGATRVVYFRRGDIASAASNADDDRLHNILIRQGRLTAPQIEMARSRLRPGVSLGKTLIEMGFLSPNELLQGARRQVRQILAACFALTEGTFQEAPGPLPPEVTVLGLPAKRLIFDALMETGDRRTIVREMGSMESVYRPSDRMADLLAALRLEPTEDEVARLIDGRATLREISGRTRLDDFAVSRIVLALDILGGVDRSPAEQPVAARPGRVIPVEAGDPDVAEEAPAAALALALESGLPKVAADVAVAPASSSEERAPAQVAESGFAGSAVAAAAGAPQAIEAARIPAEVPIAVVLPPASREPVPSQSPSSGVAASFAVSDGRIRDDEPEPSPPPPDDLPAFADPVARPSAWMVDPETGERSHPGPIEMTFDGTVAQRFERPPLLARPMLIAIIAVAVAAAAATAYGLLRRAPDDGAATSAEAPASAGAAPIATEAIGKEAGPRAPAAPAVAEAPPADAPAVAGAGAGAPAQPPATAPVETPRRETAAAAPPGVQETHVPAPRPAAPTDRRAEWPDLAPAGALLDAGRTDEAARAFQSALARLDREGYTLQILIACDPANVVKAWTATRPEGPLLALPVTIQGRACYRVLWGLYADRAAAEEATTRLPPYFLAAGVHPAPVPVARLRPPS